MSQGGVRQCAHSGWVKVGGPRGSRALNAESESRPYPETPGTQEVLKKGNDLMRVIHLRGCFCVDEAGKPGQRLLENLKARNREDLNESRCP